MLSLKPIHQFVLTGLTSILFLGNAPAATVSISPNSGIGSALAIISGSELPPNDRVDIEWSSAGPDSSFIGLVAEDVPTDGNGNFIVPIVAPKGSSKILSAIISVFKKGGLVLGSTSFTVIDKHPKGCPDAYFIGLHGTGEGPDGPNQMLSRVIGETWDHFYNLAQLDGKNVRGYAIDYPAPGGVQALMSASNARRGKDELNKFVRKTVFKQQCPEHNNPKIVLVGYSLGAWAVNKWLVSNWKLWKLINAVELYGDPLWYRKGKDYLNNPFEYNGIARAFGLEGGQNPYDNNPLGPESGILTLANRWQSRCLKGDPVCGEGHNGIPPLNQLDLVKNCESNPCEHKNYTIVNSGYNLQIEAPTTYTIRHSLPRHRTLRLYTMRRFAKGI